MTKVTPLPPPAIYQLKITLRDTRPPIWRRIQVRSDMALPKLHRILQETMGWYDSHLHQFFAGGMYYGAPDEDELFESDLKDERKVRLHQLLSKPKQRMVYEYDFGDSWEHEIVLEKILPPEPGTRYPKCLAGARACPPEDVGGTGGYGDFIAAMHDPKHERHKEFREWYDGDFDPEEFDLDLVNGKLKSIR